MSSRFKDALADGGDEVEQQRLVGVIRARATGMHHHRSPSPMGPRLFLARIWPAHSLLSVPVSYAGVYLRSVGRLCVVRPIGRGPQVTGAGMAEATTERVRPSAWRLPGRTACSSRPSLTRLFSAQRSQRRQRRQR